MFNSVTDRVKKFPLPVLLFIVLLLIGISIYTGIQLRVENTQIKYLKSSVTRLETENSILKIPTPTMRFVSPSKCGIYSSNPKDGYITTDDKYFYADFTDHTYRICSIKDRMQPGELNSRSQFGNIYLFSYANLTDYASGKSVFFKLDIKTKQLIVFDVSVLGNKQLNTFFGPHGNRPDQWSLTGTYALVQGLACSGCDPGDGWQQFVFNTKTNKFTPLGIHAMDIVWLSNNTIKWREYIFRERTKADGGDRYSYGFIWEPREFKTLTLN